MGETKDRLAAGKIYRDSHPDRHRFTVDDRRVVDERIVPDRKDATAQGTSRSLARRELVLDGQTA